MRCHYSLYDGKQNSKIMNVNPWQDAKKQDFDVQERDAKKLLDRKLAMERGKKAASRQNLNIQRERQQRMVNSKNQSAFRIASIQRQQQIPKVKDVCGGIKTCSTLPLQSWKTTFVAKTIAEKEMDAYEDAELETENQRKELNAKLDLQEKRRIDMEDRFQIALNKKHLQEKYARTLEMLDWAQKTYQRQCAIEASVSAQKIAMCPPIDKMVQRDQQCKMELLVEKAFKSNKEHAIEDLEGYYDELENFPFEKHSDANLREKSGEKDLDISSLMRPDSFIEQYFHSKKASDEEILDVTDMDVFHPTAGTSQMQDSSQTSALEGIMGKSSEKKNIGIQAKPDLSSKCIQAELKREEKQIDKSQRDGFEPKVVQKDVIDSSKSVASTQQLKPNIKLDSSVGNSLNIASQNSESSSVSSSTRYYSLPQTFEKQKAFLHLLKSQGKSTLNKQNAQVAHSSEKKSISPVAKSASSNRSINSERDLKKLETSCYFPPLSDTVPSVPDLFGYLKHLSSKYSQKLEDNICDKVFSKQAVALSEPIRERPLPNKELFADSSGKMEDQTLMFPGMQTSENIVKECQRDYLISESIKKVMSMPVNHERSASNENAPTSRIESDVSLDLSKSNHRITEEYPNASLLANLSYVDISNGPQAETSSSQHEQSNEEISTKNFKMLQQVLEKQLKHLCTSLENKSYGSGEVEVGFEGNEKSVIEQQDNIPFIYHDLSTIQEVDSALTSSPSISFATLKCESENDGYNSRKSMASHRMNYNVQQGNEIELQSSAVTKTSPSSSISSNGRSHSVTLKSSSRKVYADAKSEEPHDINSEISRKHSNSHLKEEKIIPLRKRQFTKGSDDLIDDEKCLKTDSFEDFEVSYPGLLTHVRAEMPINPRPAQQSLTKLTNNALLDVANSMINSQSYKCRQPLHLLNSITERSFLAPEATNKSNSVDSHISTLSEHISQRSSKQSPVVYSSPDLRREVNREIIIYSDGSSGSAFQPLSLLSDVESTVSQTSHPQVRLKKTTNGCASLGNIVFSGTHSEKKQVDIVSKRDNSPIELDERKIEDASLSSGGSYKPLSLIWNGSRSSSVNSCYVPDKFPGTQTSDFKRKATVIGKSQQENNEFDCAKSTLSLTGVAESGKPCSKVIKSHLPSTSVASNANIVPLPTTGKDALLKDGRHDVVGYSSSSEENLAEMFTGSKIFHQSTPIKGYEDPAEEKGILEEPDLTLIGSEASIDSLTNEKSEDFVSEKTICANPLIDEEIISESESKALPASDEENASCSREDIRTESMLSFLQHEISSLLTDEHVSLLSTTSSSPNKK